MSYRKGLEMYDLQPFHKLVNNTDCLDMGETYCEDVYLNILYLMNEKFEEKFSSGVIDWIHFTSDAAYDRAIAEFDAMYEADLLDETAFLYVFCKWMRDNGFDWWCRANTAASLNLYLFDITHTNPLNPNYNLSWELLYGDSLWGLQKFPTQLYIDVEKEVFSRLTEILTQTLKLIKDANMIEFADYGNVAKLGRITIHCIDPKTLQKDEDDYLISDKEVDYIYNEGLKHTTNCYDEDAQFMINNLGYKLTDMIVFSDDVYKYFIRHGETPARAWHWTKTVNYASGFKYATEEMLNAADKWVLDRFNRGIHTWPKAHAIEFLAYRNRIFERQNNTPKLAD